jgi:hypothetical protein
MAVTLSKITPQKKGKIVEFPIKASNHVYAGTFAVIDSTGYLANATSANVGAALMVVIPVEEYSETTAAAGAYNDVQLGTADRTVKCYVDGIFKIDFFTSISQAMVGTTMYISDNYTIDDSSSSAIKAGALIGYRSSTSGYLDLNRFYHNNTVNSDLMCDLVPLIAINSAAVGAVIQWANPIGANIIIENVVLNLATAATDTSCAIDVGIAADTTTSGDNIFDGFVLSPSGYYSAQNVSYGGTNGSGYRKMTSAQYMNGTNVASSHLTSVGAVGTFQIYYRAI